MDKKYYLGLDIGTDSIGYAVTDEQYNVLKYRGEPAWGVHLFDAAELAAERRAFRVARRRIDRRNQRVTLLQELFAEEIAKVDPRFFIRQRESALYPQDKPEIPSLFNDDEYTDADYHEVYPTIHHLIVDLMNSDGPRDVRLVYLACAWLVAHRGHFLNEIATENVEKITDFATVYAEFEHFFTDKGYALPFTAFDAKAFEDALRLKTSLSRKSRALFAACFGDGKPPKESSEAFPYNCEVLLKCLCGSKVAAKDLLCSDEYGEVKSFSLGSDDETLNEVMGQLGENAELITAMKTLYDWSLLVGILSGHRTISEAKIAVYDLHAEDLKLLKRLVKKYLPTRFDEVFRDIVPGNYTHYAYHSADAFPEKIKGKATQAEFCEYIRKLFKNVTPDEEDREAFEDMIGRCEKESFMPKQKSNDNRVIPYQLYWYELSRILERAESYLPFLAERGEDGLSVSDKILCTFSFRVPYFVGPLNSSSEHAWVVRAPGRITPWNFEKLVDLDASEAGFIKKLINKCTYLPEENVLPKDSLMYHRFTVLNEINNIKVNERPISVEVKQGIYNDVFMNYRKVTLKRIKDYLLSTGVMREGDSLSGIDINVKSDLKPQHDFKKLLQSGTLTEAQVEDIIEHRSYAEDVSRFKKWLAEHYGGILSGEDLNYVFRLKYKDFGRLSRRFLSAFEGADCRTGELMTILGAMWNTNNNLMELLSERYTFRNQLDELQKDFYSTHPRTLPERLDEMYVSAAVRRPIVRTMEIVKEVVKAFGGAPEKIFVEMARGGLPEQKGKRTQSRREQLFALYDKCRDEDVRLLRKQIEDMGAEADSRLQSDKLFLYYCQLGRCMYTNAPIDLDALMHGDTGRFNIEHIYPQAAVSDDSVINNKVLVDSKVNGAKSDSYPIDAAIRDKMSGFWAKLRSNGLISDEKFKRLTRSTPFSADEKWGFINRQLTETTQSTKAVAALLKEDCPETEIVYVKARLASEFRHEFDCVKSRLYNDLHHAKDAYLNIVVGNVYHTKFTRRWFSVDDRYSVKLSTLFTRPQVVGGVTVWDGTPMLDKVRRMMAKNNIHFTKYAYIRQGMLFKQQPVRRRETNTLIPRKKDLPVEKYGGYIGMTISCFLPVKFKSGKKSDVIIMPVELLFQDEINSGIERAICYAKKRIEMITGKPVTDISFPLGLHALKINTLLSFDGFVSCLAESSTGGKQLLLSPLMPFIAGHDVEQYLKKLESFCDKHQKNPSYVYDSIYDGITKEENEKLYNLYIEKLKSSIYRKRAANPLDTLIKGQARFSSLEIFEQSEVLLNTHHLFTRLTTLGCDVSLIGGSKQTGVPKVSTFVSNWKKSYTSVRIIDRAASGLWEKASENLLDLL